MLKTPTQFIIPVYQRPYSWTTKECKRLLDGIIEAGKPTYTKQNKFIGIFLYQEHSTNLLADVKKLTIIDIQQRLTTISLFWVGLVEFLKREPKPNLDHNKLRDYYLINREESNELRFKLLHNKKEDRETYISLLMGHDLPENKSLLMLKNYQMIVSSINDNNYLEIYNGLHKLHVIQASIEKDDEDAQTIFENLNSTGKALCAADLIRNSIFMSMFPEVQSEIYETYWRRLEEFFGERYDDHFDKFMRSYMSVKEKNLVKKELVYPSFVKFKSNSGLTINQVVKDIYTFGKYYSNIAFSKESDNDLRKAFEDLSALKMDIFYPFLLPVYQDYDNGILGKGDFLKIIQYIESYFIRRHICGIPQQGSNKLFAEYFYKSIDKDNYLESFLFSLYNLSTDSTGLPHYRRFPTDEELNKHFHTFPIYNTNQVKHVLFKLENYNTKERVNFDKLTIEHIIPQKKKLSDDWKSDLGSNWSEVRDKYLHTIGNLTLTGYNLELSTKPFKDKKVIKGGFDSSPLRLNSYLKTIDSWNEQTIIERSKLLFNDVKNIWPDLNISDEVKSKYKNQDDFTLENYKNLTEETIDLFKNLEAGILNLDTSIVQKFHEGHISFVGISNIVDVVPKKNKLILKVYVDYSDLDDPNDICKELDDDQVEITINHNKQLDSTLNIISKCIEYQFNEYEEI